MVSRRAVVAGGLLSLSLAASAVGLGAPPASRAGGGGPPARPPATTLVTVRLLPLARCAANHCRAPRSLRGLRAQALVETLFRRPGKSFGGAGAAPPVLVGRDGRFWVRLRPGCYQIAVVPDYAGGGAPDILPLFPYELRVGPGRPETVGLRPTWAPPAFPCRSSSGAPESRPAPA